VNVGNEVNVGDAARVSVTVGSAGNDSVGGKVNVHVADGVYSDGGKESSGGADSRKLHPANASSEIIIKTIRNNFIRPPESIRAGEVPLLPFLAIF
jgi:hypothetical protein